MPNDKLIGKKLLIVGVVEEHLRLDSKSQEWVSIRLENGILITINIKYCKVVEEQDDNADGKSNAEDSRDR